LCYVRNQIMPRYRLGANVPILVFALIPVLAAQPSRAVLESRTIRIEATIEQGALHERYYGRAGSAWIELATHTGGAVTSLASHGEALTEELTLGDLRIQRTIRLTSRGQWLQVTTRASASTPVTLHSFSDTYRTLFAPDFSYAPSIGGFVPDFQYKAPLILVQSARRAFGIVPDVLALTHDQLRRCNHSLDLDVTAGPLLTVGFIPAMQAMHSVYREDLDRQWTLDQPIENSYFLYLAADAPPGEAYREAVRFHWDQFARRQIPDAASIQTGTDARFSQCNLFDSWRRVVWDRESPAEWLSVPLPDGSTGGAVKMLRWGAPDSSVYLGAWFNSLRTSYGMALDARRTGNGRLMDLARQTLRLALSAPGRDGAFKCIAVPRANGSVDWGAGDGDGGSTVHGYLGFDMSWTAYWMLRWRLAGLPESDGVLDRCARLARFLIDRQQPDGMLPTRFDENGGVETGASRTVQAETAPAALFLLELYKASPQPEYFTAARKALAFLDRSIIPERKWYDFETFWSCSPRFISRDERTGQWPANNLALIHAVAAYRLAFELTHLREYLARGEALLDYLLLYQQSWTNPLLEDLNSPVMLLGGFTTQNSDAEWSDARQSLAGNVLLDYYRTTGNVEYLERGVEALRAQFPVSPSENWAHTGRGKKAGVSSFHWGTGSGMAGIEIDQDDLRDAIFDVAAGRGIGVNGLNLTAAEVSGNRIAFRLESPFPWTRPRTVLFRHTDPTRVYTLTVNGQSTSFSGKELEAGVQIP
jgi:hypothetical protein